ncbi:hypothetical protein HYW18_01340 [Candidatus Uhrbacteria bacterium]|nr:hypothetical protein [Candidatus Uhrbacteria bacterium]
MSEPISVGQVIDKSWLTYRAHFSELVSISGWLLVSVIASIIGLSFSPPAASLYASLTSFSATETVGTVLQILNNFLVAPILYIWIFAATARFLRARDHGGSTKLSAVGREGWKRFWPLTWVTILFSVLMLAAFLPLAPGLLFLFGGSFLPSLGAPVSSLGTLLLILGVFASAYLVLRWGIRYYFAPLSLAYNDMQGQSAFMHSRRLVAGRFWETLIRLVLPKVLYFIIFAAALFILVIFGEVLIGAVSGLNIELHARLSTIVFSLLVGLQSIVLNPLVMITDYVVFQDIEKRV